MKLSLTFPITNGFISQKFGENANTLYSNGGLYGHPGVDIVSSYDDPIEDCVLGFNKKYVYSLLNKDNPDLSKYRAVCQIVEADDGVFEVIYGHCNKITCELGPTVTKQKLATEGNTGDVFVGGRQITAKEKKEGSKAGAHVHFQVRRLRKTRETTLNSLTYDGIHDYIDSDGFHFDVPNYNNGYNGCIDPQQFVGFQNNYKFTKDLDYGFFNFIDIYQLQKRLVRLGFGSFTPTGFFGELTRQAITLYQEANGIDQVGRVGPITRSKLNG